VAEGLEKSGAGEGVVEFYSGMSWLLWGIIGFGVILDLPEKSRIGGAKLFGVVEVIVSKFEIKSYNNIL